MAFFSKRETLTQNIAYMAMMAAINIIFSLIATFFPLSGIFIMVVLPFVNAMVGYYCKTVYYPIYLCAVIGLSIACTAWDFSNTLLYVVPAAVAGLAYGLLSKLGIPSSLLIFAMAIIDMGFAYLSLWIINLIYEIDMISFLLSLLSLEMSPLIEAIIPSAIFAYALGQASLAHLFIAIQPLKLNAKEASQAWWMLIYPLSSILFFLLTLCLAFFHPASAYFCMFSGIYWSIISISKDISKPQKWVFVCEGSSLLIGAILFSLLYSRLEEGLGLLLLSLPFAIAMIASLLWSVLLFKRGRAPKIEQAEKEK